MLHCTHQGEKAMDKFMLKNVFLHSFFSTFFLYYFHPCSWGCLAGIWPLILSLPGSHLREGMWSHSLQVLLLSIVLNLRINDRTSASLKDFTAFHQPQDRYGEELCRFFEVFLVRLKKTTLEDKKSNKRRQPLFRIGPVMAHGRSSFSLMFDDDLYHLLQYTQHKSVKPNAKIVLNKVQQVRLVR